MTNESFLFFKILTTLLDSEQFKVNSSAKIIFL